MGKRKHKDEEEHLQKKMRKLERKMAKIRRKRVSSSSSSSVEEKNLVTEETADSVWCSEVEQTQDTTYEDAIPSMTLDAVDPDEPEVVADVPLDKNILNILGDEPAKEDSFSASIHNDIAVRWSEILLSGLKDDISKDILKSYDVPENLKLALPPLLNPEIKAAVNESFTKRDGILKDKQKLLACAISCLATLMSNMINDKALINNNQASATLKQLSDAGRLLCHLHSSETNTRKQFLMTGLSKNVKDNIKDQKRDQWLFGAELSEKLRSLKAISKTGAEMKATPPFMGKPRTPFRNRQPEASTSRALNWRGPPPPPPPRHASTRPSSTTGGRRQPPVTSYRTVPHRRPARSQQQQTRRR